MKSLVGLLVCRAGQVDALQYGDDSRDWMAPAVDADSNNEKPDSATTFEYGPELVRPAMEYFQHWSLGAVSQHLLTPRVSLAKKADSQNSILQNAVAPADRKKVGKVKKVELSAGAWASYLLAKEQRSKGCESQSKTDLREWELHASESADKHDVKHTVFRSPTGQFQYVVERHGQLLLADPPACRKPSQQVALLEQDPEDKDKSPSEGEDEKGDFEDEKGDFEDKKGDFDGEDNFEGKTTKAAKEATLKFEGDGDKGACACQESWDYLEKVHHGCSPIEFDGFSWCYVVDGDKCAEAEDSLIEHETRKWKKCELSKEDKDELRQEFKDKKETQKGLGHDNKPNKDDGPRPMVPPSGGGPELLDSGKDPMVQDCVKLLTRTVKKKCHDLEFKFKVLASTLSVISGLEVSLTTAVTGQLGKVAFHTIKCAFELQTNHSTLDESGKSLIENDDPDSEDPDKSSSSSISSGSSSSSKKKQFTSNSDIPEKDKTEEEKQGLHATLVMAVDVCDMESSNTIAEHSPLKEVNATDKDEKKDHSLASWASSMLQHRFGEISLYKGYEHYNDRLPRVRVPKKHGLPDSYDLRSEYAKCFPLQATEVVRDQGNCGSCWAFASATAAMTNLCISASRTGDSGKSLANAEDRYEVSVQQIMSCNDNQAGCEGGSSVDADTAMRSGGITKERDSQYSCGGGNPLDHFEAKGMSCDAAPWGAECLNGNNKDNDWTFGGAVVVAGEEPMKTVIAGGYALYAAIGVWSDFMTLGAGTVYTGPSGSASNVGGHAITIVGYGQSSGTKTWIIQNSWNLAWADNGYGLVERGTDTIGIEQLATYFRAWVTGADVPPCMDGASTGLSTGDGTNIPCSAAKGQYGDLCEQFPVVKSNCPIECDTCIGRSSSDPGSFTNNDPSNFGDNQVPDVPDAQRDGNACLEGTLTGGDDLWSLFMGLLGPAAQDCNFVNKCSYTVQCATRSDGLEYPVPTGGPFNIAGNLDFCEGAFDCSTR